MGGTIFKRLDIGGPDVAVFEISGKLGFHENLKVERLVKECLKRRFKLVVFNFSELISLGGGVAKILRRFVDEYSGSVGEVRFVVTNDIVLKFLQDEGNSISIFRSLDEAMPDAGEGGDTETGTRITPGKEHENSELPGAGAGNPGSDSGPETPEQGEDGVILMAYDGTGEARSGGGKAGLPEGKADGPAGDGSDTGDGEAIEIDRSPEHGGAGGKGGADNSGSIGIFSEIFGNGPFTSPPAWIEKPTSPFSKDEQELNVRDDDFEELNKRLKRRILELKTLFSISCDFSTIRDKKKLLDIFLLTSIAQGGVESAVFLEKRGEHFETVMSKGINLDNVEGIRLSGELVKEIENENVVIGLDNLSLTEENAGILKKEGIEYICPFHQLDGLAGLVLLGKRIAGRGMKKDDFEFIKILVSIAQGAYENAVSFERENERTLGIVKSLISLIEENTLVQGSSEFVSRYVGMVAKSMGYPDDHFKDLIYGTVLRDMGMIKISDLILRSPRDLNKEEWEIIKKHPEDGANMLERMKFNNHIVDIVRTHHERFNGEGYPLGLRGKGIPFGSRIISVIESYTAMINERPNRPALSEKEALDTLKENHGLRYDREVVLQFSRIMEKELAKSVHPTIITS